MEKHVNLAEVFTAEMVDQAKKCGSTAEIKEKVILPNMERINEMTGQENDPGYWSYAMEYFLVQSKRRS